MGLGAVAQAYQDMQAHLRYRTDIQHFSVRDIIGPNAYFIDQMTPVLTEERNPRGRKAGPRRAGGRTAARVDR